MVTLRGKIGVECTEPNCHTKAHRFRPKLKVLFSSEVVASVNKLALLCATLRWGGGVVSCPSGFMKCLAVSFSFLRGY